MNKTLALLILVLTGCGSVSSQSSVASRTPAPASAEILEIEKLVDGAISAWTLESETATEAIDEIAKDLCGSEYGTDDCTIENGRFPEFDSTNPRTGTLPFDDAVGGIMQMGETNGVFSDLNAAHKKDVENRIGEILKGLEGNGYIFAYDAAGATFCGVHQGTTLLIDLKQHTIYQIGLKSSEC